MKFEFHDYLLWLFGCTIKFEVFCNCIKFCLIFPFFLNDHFLLFVLARVVANHKTTEADVLNKIFGVLKYAPDKIGVGFIERW